MTEEEEARLEEAEQTALRMLNRATSEGRWYPRRHQRFALLIGLPIVLIVVGFFVVLALLIQWAITGR